MTDLLFAVPWWIPTLLALLGIVLFLNGNKSQVAKVRNIGAAVVAIAIGWALLSYFVDTDKEKVERGTKEFVQSAVDGAGNGDWSKFKEKLAPDVSFWISSQKILDGLPAVSTFAGNGAEYIKLKSAQVRDLTCDQTGDTISAHCEVFTTEELPPMETSTWQFDWEKTPAGWKIRHIRVLKVKDIADGDLAGIVHRVPKR